MKRLSVLIMALGLSLSIILTGCNWSNTAKGGAIGAGAGAGVGALIGKAAGNTAVGAIIGAAVGGTAGALIGRHMDKQAEEMRRDLKGVKVERVGEGIKLTFESGILFDSGSSELKGSAKDNIAELSQILNKYRDTNIIVEGHTDNTGSAEVNQKLSEARAAAVASYLQANSVEAGRISTMGYGFNQPVADNSTASGKAQNRRVEVAIFANKKMQRAAERGELE